MLSKLNLLIIAPILIFAAIIRFYSIGNAGFDYDQEYAANFAYSVVREYPVQMIGQGLSVQGLFMGPLYFYFLTPFFMLTNLHPIGGVIGSVFLGLTTIFIYFYIFKSVFGLKAAIIASVLRAGLFSFIGTDLSMTPAFSADLPALITWFCLYKYWDGRLNYLIPLSFIFGLYTSYHPILFPFYLVFLTIFAVKRKIPRWKIIASSIILFLIPIIPLICFEYFHDFIEVKQLFSLASGSTNGMKNFAKLADILNANNPLYTFFGVYSLNFSLAFGKMWGALLYIPLLVLIYLRRNFWKNSFHKIILFSTYLIFISYYFLLPVNITEYYFIGLNTIFFIYSVASFSQIKNNRIVLFVIFSLILINLHQWYQQTQRSNGMTLSDKEMVVKQIVLHTSEDKPFFVSYITRPGFSFGYSYLFKIHNRIPSTDAKPPIFNIVSPKSLVGDEFDFESGDIGLIFPK